MKAPNGCHQGLNIRTIGMAAKRIHGQGSKRPIAGSSLLWRAYTKNGYLPSAPYLLFYGADVGDVARSGNAIFVVLGAALASYIAYQRTQ